MPFYVMMSSATTLRYYAILYCTKHLLFYLLVSCTVIVRRNVEQSAETLLRDYCSPEGRGRKEGRKEGRKVEVYEAAME